MEVEFNKVCGNLSSPLRISIKQEIKWDKNDPLRFWQSLAFILSNQDLACVAVSYIADTTGVMKLYIASTDPMSEDQKQEITEIINMFTEMKPIHELSARLVPRHMSYILRQLDKMGVSKRTALERELPGELSETVNRLSAKHTILKTLNAEEITGLLEMIVDNRKILRDLKDGKTKTLEAQQAAKYLCKMIRVSEETAFVYKKLIRHQQDPALKLLNAPCEFISFNCHPELAILKVAQDCCASNSFNPVYIGVSKRPCYCCSALFKYVVQNKSVPFDISIVAGDGKLYEKWNKIEHYFDKEFRQVWAKTIQDYHLIKKSNVMQTDDIPLSGSFSEQDDYLVAQYKK